MGIIEMGDKSVGAERPHSYRVLPDLGVGHRGLAFLIGPRHLGAVYRQAEGSARGPSPADVAAQVPEKVARHSLAARLFHWIMAAAMFALLITAFLPKVGVSVPLGDVPLDRGAGAHRVDPFPHHPRHVLMDFWSIWPDKIDIEDAQETLAAGHGQIRARSAQVRQVSAGKQDVSPGHRAGRACR